MPSLQFIKHNISIIMYIYTLMYNIYNNSLQHLHITTVHIDKMRKMRKTVRRICAKGDTRHDAAVCNMHACMQTFFILNTHSNTEKMKQNTIYKLLSHLPFGRGSPPVCAARETPANAKMGFIWLEVK